MAALDACCSCRGGCVRQGDRGRGGAARLGWPRSGLGPTSCTSDPERVSEDALASPSGAAGASPECARGAAASGPGVAGGDASALALRTGASLGAAGVLHVSRAQNLRTCVQQPERLGKVGTLYIAVLHFMVPGTVRSPPCCHTRNESVSGTEPKLVQPWTAHRTATPCDDACSCWGCPQAAACRAALVLCTRAPASVATAELVSLRAGLACTAL